MRVTESTVRTERGGREGMRGFNWEMREGLMKVHGEQMEGGKGGKRAAAHVGGGAAGAKGLRQERA